MVNAADVMETAKDAKSAKKDRPETGGKTMEQRPIPSVASASSRLFSALSTVSALKCKTKGERGRA